jgi:hypothetical protein
VSGVRRDISAAVGPEAAAFLRLTRRVAGLLVAGAVAAALVSGAEPTAPAAVALGGALAGLAHHWLARGLAELLGSRASAGRGRLWAVASLVPRQGLLGLAFFAAVVPLRLPPAWLLLGVSAWPAAFVTAAWLSTRSPAPAPLAAARASREP